MSKRCPSTNKCQMCRCSHHTLLHKEKATPPAESSSFPSPEEPTLSSQTSDTLKIAETKSEVHLGTAQVNICNYNGISIIDRALLDSASQLSFITERMAQWSRWNNDCCPTVSNCGNKISSKWIHYWTQCCHNSIDYILSTSTESYIIQLDHTQEYKTIWPNL